MNLDGVKWKCRVPEGRQGAGAYVQRSGFGGWQLGLSGHAFGSREEAADAMRVAMRLPLADRDKVIAQFVRIRPRVSLVTAVRRCVEAREMGVELWFRPVDGCEWRQLVGGGVRHYNFNFIQADGRRWPWVAHPADVLARYIVATPEDAKRIDARAKHAAKVVKLCPCQMRPELEDPGPHIPRGARPLPRARAPQPPGRRRRRGPHGGSERRLGRLRAALRRTR